MKKRNRWSPKLLRDQLILWFVAVIVVLLGVLAYVTAATLRPSLYDTHVNHLQRTTTLLCSQLNSTRASLQAYSVNILADDTVQGFLTGAYDDKDPTETSNMLRTLLMRYSAYDRRIRGLYLVDGQGEIYGNNVTRTVTVFVKDTLPQVKNSSGNALWSTAYQKDTAVMFRVIHETTRDLNRQLGALYMLVDCSAFMDTASQYMNDEQCWRLEGRGFALGDPLPEDTDNYFLCTASAGDWTLTTWLRRSVVYAPADKMLSVLMLALLATLLVGVALVVFISGRLTRPLQEIGQAMMRFGSGDMDVVVPVRRDDETAALARTFNRMIADTRSYIRQNEENQRRQRALELKALQGQINPHFLYNTLDSIYMMAREEGSEKIASLVISLSTLFRLGLAHGHDFVSLEHEVRYITCYLDIQKIRFPQAFSWSIDVPEELRGRRVLKFLLQPLVENSVNHGLRNSFEAGHIHVCAAREGDDLVLRVTDNGNGMTEEALERLRSFMNRTDVVENTDPFAGGVGVRNVHQRMLLYYNRGIEIDSQWEEGTTVTLRIPYAQTESNKEDIP